ncbi:MAG: hypothetical protein IJY66_05845 [Clostridia bacterium]|nr:hypothetical protein [Clostridia bacterium]
MKNYLQDAAWIWARDYDEPNMFLVAECPLRVPPDATGAWTLHISVDSDFALYCSREGRENTCPAFGQFTDYASHKVCEERVLDAEQLRGGRLYLLLTSQNCDTSTDRRECAGVIFCLCDATGTAVWRSDAQTLLYRTDRHRSRGVPMVTGQLGFSFDIDYTAPLCGERCVTEVLSDMPSELYPRPIAPLQMGEHVPSTFVKRENYAEIDGVSEMAFGVRMQRAPFVASHCAQGTAYIFDLGAEQVGFLTLDVTLAKETDVLIGWGEHLADGRVRTEIGGRCFAGRCRLPAGQTQLLYPLRRLGLRYLQLNVAAQSSEVSIAYAGVCPVDYPLPEPLPYPAGVQGIRAEIYDACLRTLRLCLHDHYEDCPWREQALYTMDSRNQMLCGYYAYDETAAPRASLALIARSLREDNLLELCSPARCSITIPAFSAMFVVQLAEYVAFSGDLATARELLPTAARIVDGFLARMEENGLLTCYPEEKHWNFYEWQTGLEGSIGGSVAPEDMTYDAPLNCFVSLAMAALSQLYMCLEQLGEAQRLLAARDRLNSAIHNTFFDSTAGVYDTYLRLRDGQRYHRAQLTQALALCCGACPSDQASRVRENLAHDATLHEVTLSYSIFRYDALLQDEAYHAFVLDEIDRIWGGMLAQGATTFWETAAGERDFGGAGSLCHGWSAVPVYVYWRYGAV